MKKSQSKKKIISITLEPELVNIIDELVEIGITESRTALIKKALKEELMWLHHAMNQWIEFKKGNISYDDYFITYVDGKGNIQKIPPVEKRLLFAFEKLGIEKVEDLKEKIKNVV